MATNRQPRLPAMARALGSSMHWLTPGSLKVCLIAGCVEPVDPEGIGICHDHLKELRQEN